MNTDTLTREVLFHPGYDYREVDASKPPGQRRGCHGLSIVFLLRGDDGAVQFKMGTDWLPTWVEPDGYFGPSVKPNPYPALRTHYPMAVDLGRHWKTPTYPDEMRMDCTYLEQGYCFYDGSGLNAEPVMAALFTGGSDAVWSALEDYYAELANRTGEGS